MTGDETRTEHRHNDGTQPEDERRRAIDTRFEAIDTKLATLKTQMEINTSVTMQIKDILTSLRITAAVCKWVSAVGAAFLAGYHGWEIWRK